MATSGFGDFHPDTDNWMEVGFGLKENELHHFKTIVAVIYISLGIVLLSALFLTFGLYYQALHHIQLREVINKFYKCHYLRQMKKEFEFEGKTGNTVVI